MVRFAVPNQNPNYCTESVRWAGTYLQVGLRQNKLGPRGMRDVVQNLPPRLPDLRKFDKNAHGH